MVLVKRIYATFLVEILNKNQNKMLIENISGYKLYCLLKDRLKYLKDSKEYNEFINVVFANENNEKINVVFLDAAKGKTDNTYNVRVEFDLFVNEEKILKEFISDIYYIFKLGVDCDFLDSKNTYCKIISVDNTFRMYNIDFSDKCKLNTLEKLISFSWNGLNLNLLNGNIIKSLRDFNGYDYSLNPQTLVIDIKYETQTTERFDLSIREYFEILYNEFVGILNDLNIDDDAACELFGFKNENRIVNPILNLDFDINLKYLRFTIMKIKDINYIVGIILLLLKDLFNGIFVLDENLIFDDYYNDVKIGNSYIKIDEEKYLKALYSYAKEKPKLIK